MITPFLKKTFLFLLLLGGLLQLSVLSGNLIISRLDTHHIPEDRHYVILGNSRPQFSLDDNLIDHFINFSRGGEPYFYTRFKARKLAEQNDHIKAVFLQYNWDDISPERNEWVWDRDHIQINYRRYSFEMEWSDYKELLLHNPFDFLNIHLFQTFPFQFKQIFLLNRDERRREFGRFHSVKGSGLEENEQSDESTAGIPDIEERHLKYLNDILEVFREHRITVYLMRTPVHHSAKRNIAPDDLMALLGRKWNYVEYLDFRDYPVNDLEFANEGHLNFSGAEEFSSFFDKLIKDGLLEKTDKSAFVKTEISRRRAERIASGDFQPLPPQ